MKHIGEVFGLLGVSFKELGLSTCLVFVISAILAGYFSFKGYFFIAVAFLLIFFFFGGYKLWKLEE